MRKPFKDIDGKALEALMSRVSEAKENDLALSAADYQLLLDALLTLSTTQERLSKHGITVAKLRKLLGIEKSSEKLTDLFEQPAKKSPSAKDKKKKKANTDDGMTAVKPVVIVHPLDTLNKGDQCTACFAGKVYKVDPGSLLRITGQSPFTPEQHVLERMRCNTCGAYFTAPLPEDVLDDGEANQKYGYTARSLMAIYKYFAGLPFYRQSSIQKLLGVKITASTVFDQCEFVCNAVHPVFAHLVKMAANAKHYYIDDTTNRILDAKPIEKKRRNSDKMQLRTGVYTSGLIATMPDGRSIVLFETNIGHAGEFIDSILHKRDKSRALPIIMSDALSSNKPSVIAAMSTLCNSHARRQFVDVLSHFPDECENILVEYAKIWTHESHAVEHNLSPSQRLKYHNEHSLPIMNGIKATCDQHLSAGTVEENSGLGKAMRYLVKHYKGLTYFCHEEDAKLDNNRIEAILKIVVRDRKNAMFHKTFFGATVGDIITSLIATGSESGINVFDYFTVLQRDEEKVRANPENYLPWNYQGSH